MCSKIVSLSLVIFIICSAIWPQQVSSGEIPAQIKKQVKKLHGRCVKQSGVSEAVMEAALMNKDKLSPDPAFKCFMHCMFDVFGLIDSAEIMHLESLTEILPQEFHSKIMGLVNACGTKKGADKCDTVYETVKCYMVTDLPFIQEAVNEFIG